MTRRASLLGALLVLVCAGLASAQQHPGLQPIPPEAAPPTPAHRTGELDCKGCHQGKHQGVVRMYLGVGGRGTPMIPSHMFQVRVECVACHVVPKESEANVGLVGQTFRPSEQACLGCHGEKYRGMLGRWSSTLAKMREIITPKLAAARIAADTGNDKSAKRTRARTLIADADYNMRFVELGHGVHNVFYSADLLKLSNAWLDESLSLLGKTAKVDDALVRGGYCAVLCHQQAGVKLPETVSFGTQKIPHARHVSEFGAVCTACHSADVHKGFTATPATCAGCHHSPQNERCEGCHRAQSAFYRGEVKTTLVKKVEPNSMAASVGCTGCHDLSRQGHPRQTVPDKCVGCHDPGYKNFMTDWTSGLDRETAKANDAVKKAEQAVARGRKNGDASAQLRDARAALALVKKARGVHNPALADALIESAQKKAEQAVRP